MMVTQNKDSIDQPYVFTLYYKTQLICNQVNHLYFAFCEVSFELEKIFKTSAFPLHLSTSTFIG